MFKDNGIIPLFPFKLIKIHIRSFIGSSSDKRRRISSGDDTF